MEKSRAKRKSGRFKVSGEFAHKTRAKKLNQLLHDKHFQTLLASNQILNELFYKGAGHGKDKNWFCILRICIENYVTGVIFGFHAVCCIPRL